MSEAKRQWSKPQLIVLTKGTPEESVLYHCKFIGAQASGPYYYSKDGCNDSATNCGTCQARAGS